MYITVWNFYNQGKNGVYITALLHFILVGVGIWSLVGEILDYQEPVTYHEGVHIVLHFGVHLILIFCLFIGTCANLPFFLLPWLGAAFVTFSILTVLTLGSLNDMKLYSIPLCLLNFVCIGAYWFSWYTVFSYFMNTYKKQLN